MKPKYEIREATAADVEAIVELNYELFREDGGQRDALMNVEWPKEGGQAHFEAFIDNENRRALVAESENEIVGYLVGYVLKPSSLYPVMRAELESMFVQEAHRGTGVGSMLVEKFVSWARHHGAKVMLVMAYAANEDAIRFYKRHGFVDKKVILEQEM